MEDIHTYVGCKPEYIGSHNVDRALNDGASVENLEWETSDGLSQKIVDHACDSHKCNISAGQASGTISHKRNLNPELGTTLNKIYDWLANISCNVQRTTVLVNV